MSSIHQRTMNTINNSDQNQMTMTSLHMKTQMKNINSLHQLMKQWTPMAKQSM